jgi:hypothetical protein
LQHLPLEPLRKVVTEEQWNSFSKVAVVRNPYDRLVSDWHWRKKHHLPLADLSFPEFVRYATELVLSSPDWDTLTNKAEFQKNFLGHFKEQVILLLLLWLLLLFHCGCVISLCCLIGWFSLLSFSCPTGSLHWISIKRCAHIKVREYIS